ncbi:MAG: HEAT repeat domain-containing protein [Planctomycetes bacterium]|nr:HEAT repeat domain-containing protein [Planctomycetota bacterium]
MRLMPIALLIFAAGFSCAQAPEVDWDKEGKALLDKAISDDPAVSIPAQDELREVGRPYVPALRAALKDTRGAVRFFACEILGEIHDSAAAADLAGMLEDLIEERTGEPVAAAAARALGKLGDASVADKLIAALDSKSLDVKYEAARALGNLRVKKAEAKLLEMLKAKETKETFRGGLLPAAACEALGKVKSVSAESEIVKMLEQSAPETRSGWSYDQIAIMALTRITGEDNGPFDGEKKEDTKKKWREWWAKQPQQPEQPK